MNPAPALRTDRLTLEPFAPDDAAALLEVFRDPAVRRHLLDDTVVEADWVAAEIAGSRSLFEERGCGLWVVRSRENGGNEEAVAGFCGFRFFHDPPELQLVCGLLPSHWGRGLATESCREIIRFAFEELGFERVMADADWENRESIRLMERLGMEFRGRMDKSGLDTASYVLERGTTP